MLRKALIGTVVVAALGAGLWLGGESLAADRLRAHIAQTPEIEAQSVTPLRSTAGMGLRIEGLSVGDINAGLALPWAVMRLHPLSPATLQLDLPPEATVVHGGLVHDLTAARREARLGLAPLSGMAVDSLDMALGGLAIDGTALAEEAGLTLSLARLGHDSPQAARAAYDARVAAQGITQEGLARLGLNLAALPGDLAAEGSMRLWLDGPLNAASPGAGASNPARIIGGRTEGVTLRSGDLSLRILARLVPDGQGYALGRVALYTTDARAIIDHLVELGVLPEAASLLALAGLDQLGRAEFSDETAGSELARVAAMAFPAATEGELRLPLEFRDGRAWLGQIPVGPAPRLLF